MLINHLKIIGCGGHSKVVLDALSLCSDSFHISCCDGNKELLGNSFCGYIIDSDMDSLTDYSGLVHIAIGNNQARQRIVHLLNPATALHTVIHPAAVVAPSARIAPGAFIAAQAVLAPDSSIGVSTIINHGAIIDHDVTIGNCSHIAPNSTLGGQVIIGNRVLIGAGAIVLPGITVGDDAIVAAGAVVIQHVKENTVVKGVPAV